MRAIEVIKYKCLLEQLIFHFLIESDGLNNKINFLWTNSLRDFEGK